MSSEAASVVAGVADALCRRAPLQLCRLTGEFAVAEQCRTRPLAEAPVFFANPGVCVLGVVGLLVCFDRTHAVARRGYAAVRARLEYATFFFAMACWYVFSVLDHSFYAAPSRAATWFVLGDAWAGAAAALALALAGIAECGRVGTVFALRLRTRVLVLAAVHAAHAAVYVACGAARGGYAFLRVFWAVVVVAGVATYAVLLAVRIARAPAVRLVVLVALVAAALVAALLCQLVFGVALCERLSPHFGGEHIAMLLLTAALWAFYYVYGRLKAGEVQHLKEVRLDDGSVAMVERVERV